MGIIIKLRKRRSYGSVVYLLAKKIKKGTPQITTYELDIVSKISPNGDVSHNTNNQSVSKHHSNTISISIR